MTVQADIKKFLPQQWLSSTGKNIPALIAAINATHEVLEQQVQACIDQLFLQTASGRYLIQLGEQSGFTMPTNSGLDIAAYRELVPIMVSDPKQVRTTLDELIKTFYNSERTNAIATASVPGPYSLVSGDDLIIETESGQVTFSIVTGQVSNFSSVTAAEIAAVINSDQSLLKAQQYIDQTTGLGYLRIVSGSSGVGSHVRIAGGKLQNVLKFPKLINTLAATGTTWILAKVSSYTDHLTFIWDGTGVNPNVYLSKIGDTVTIRGLVDGAAPFSLLDGSYSVVDIGYNYFVIKNSSFTTLSATLVQNLDNNIVFTSSDKIGLYSQSEYAFTSESDGIDTITMTVPAIPPLSRRALAGSGHLHGSVFAITDFTRNGVTVTIPSGSDKPAATNRLVLRNNKTRANFRDSYYDTVAVDTSTTTPTYTISADPGAALFPYTTPVSLGTDPISATIDSNRLILTTQEQHGFERGWGITIAGATGLGNITTGDLNKEHQVAEVIDDFTLAFDIFNADGSAKNYTGSSFGAVDVYQYSTPQSDGADFYILFSTLPNLDVGDMIKFDPGSGAPIVNFLAIQLYYKHFEVLNVNNYVVDFRLGAGPNANGQIIAGITGKNDGQMGGTPTYYLDKTSALNQDRLFSGLSAVFTGYTPSSNPEYVGSYLYDPTGTGFNVTVSRFIVNTTSPILKGDNISALFVDTLTVGTNTFPQSGELVMDYGSDSFEGPIKYLATVQNSGSNQILIDPSYKFKNAHATGASVQFLDYTYVFAPDQLGTSLPVYVTGTVQARNTMFALAKLLTAAGIFVNENVLLPDLRYADTAIVPFE